EIQTANTDLAIDHAWVGTELIGPRGLREYDHCISAGHAILVGHEEPAKQRPELEHVEEVAADSESKLRLRRLVRLLRKAGDDHVVGERACVAPRLAAEVAGVRG